MAKKRGIEETLTERRGTDSGRTGNSTMERRGYSTTEESVVSYESVHFRSDPAVRKVVDAVADADDGG
ncbi:extensin [Iris pallida]|uniref:Extensin n=1 Tax=Iris pallida TaxID=29817 RepID=A0AAX6DVT7_IRIPA|nr:extensin [Iris pallida]